ncbi:MAG: glycosyltransferase family 2 protein [Planctomycetes bacterium]|nr:glycosyltransferase family 2 protein [Planctomycetota bacterium]
MPELPPVTVVVLNFDGREHLGPCLDSLRRLEYPAGAVTIHLVDNGSRDGSVAMVARCYPEVRITAFPENRGFSAAVNHAVQAATTPLVALLNNDTRVDPRWLAELVGPVVRGEAAAAGARIVDWQGRRDLFQAGGCNFHGIGFQAGLHGMTRDGAPAGPAEVLFACGAAMAIRRDLFLEVGGFDEDFFAFYEDVDLGWRLWVLGHRVVVVPAAVVYHRHSATASRVPLHQLRVLHVRNPLLTILKNYEQDHLARIFPAALLLSIRRMSFLANLDPEPYRIERPAARRPRGRWRWWGRRAAGDERVALSRVALSDLIALEDVNRQFARFLEKRAVIQAARRRRDREIFPLFRAPFWAVEQAEDYLGLQNCLLDHFGIRPLFAPGAPADTGAPAG